MDHYVEYKKALRAQFLNDLTDADLTMIANALKESAASLRVDAEEAQLAGNEDTARGLMQWSHARLQLGRKVAGIAGWGSHS